MISMTTCDKPTCWDCGHLEEECICDYLYEVDRDENMDPDEGEL